MKKRIIAIICGVVAVAVIVTGAIISFTRMEKSESIGADTALNIAINDTGLNKNEITNTKSEFEHDKMGYIFDVEFYSNGTEYEYYVDAKTGGIIKSGNEKSESPSGSQTGSTEQTSSTDTTSASQTTAPSSQASDKYIGLEKAKQIALDDAQVSVKDAVFRKAKIDYENGKAIYEIEFIKGSTEYEYEIDAESGTIIDSEKETLG